MIDQFDIEIRDLSIGDDCRDLLAAFERVSDLPDELSEIPGVGDVRARRIRTAIDHAMRDRQAGAVGIWSTRDGGAVLRAHHKGVNLKIIVGADKLLAKVFDAARDVRRSADFAADCRDEAKQWAVAAADEMAGSRAPEKPSRWHRGGRQRA